MGVNIRHRPPLEKITLENKVVEKTFYKTRQAALTCKIKVKIKAAHFLYV